MKPHLGLNIVIDPRPCLPGVNVQKSTKTQSWEGLWRDFSPNVFQRYSGSQWVILNIHKSMFLKVCFEMKIVYGMNEMIQGLSDQREITSAQR